ncbi:putative transcriptional regulator (Cti6) [Aspergillus candidus]|uniref:Zinc finger PHD-type domain-containing protein n=1 Tax=Aspergillus candidus TaxID=41067 RepID=A0A2I2FBE2_ASPCN|nr:hypothetical protein BDW47DRAFT_106092 [Aspergillus candidus]PLB37937.1 hypothetical protein BDW47DRAFT_106092 [Aspergillus candidus]
MTPRRSSRARTSQPSPAILPHTNSSSSSSSMTRERSTRSNHKIPSPHGSSGHRSQSAEEVDAGSKMDYPQTRQRQRARGDDDPSLGEGEEEDGEEDEEEEEVTRCLCGQQEYPGLPPSRREALGRSGMRPRVKEDASLNPPPDSSELMSDDMGSMFIQCDSCKVWQHGGCVGIMDEAMSPDEYYCEECRKELHRIKSEVNGSRSSTYLPVVAPSSTAVSSRESSHDPSKRSKDSKSRNNDMHNPKRRSTMNSRDAAYDEEELIRRAIEESKEDNQLDTDEASVRRGKRSRSDSEAHKQVAKKQRTSSPSPGIPEPSKPVSQPVSEDDKEKEVTNGTRRQRATSRGQRDKETKEPEEPEEESPENNRRRGRTDPQKDDGEAESNHEAASSPKPVVAPEPEPLPPSPNETPVPPPETTAARPSTRKSGRPPARRGGRVGRNQYTRDRDVNGTDSNGTLNSPRRGQSYDIGGESPRIGGPNGHVNGEVGKPSRPRYVNQRTTMNEMKRRVAGILEFISRMQVEMAVAGQTSPPGGDQPNGSIRAMAEQIDAKLSSLSDGESATTTTDGEAGPVSAEKDFKGLSSVEMMDVLTRHLLKWQQEYGKFGER